jgi:hypothetical protein
MSGNTGAFKGFGGNPNHPNKQKDNDNGKLFVSDNSKNSMSRLLDVSPKEKLASPVGSLTYQQGGVYIGKRALDKWKYNITGVRNVVVLGDSLGQAAAGGADGFPNRLARTLGLEYAPELTTQAGFYGLYRSGGSTGFINTDAEWYGNGTWTIGSNTNSWNLGPQDSTMLSTSAARRTDATMATTINSKTITCVTASFFSASDLGALITGPGIPPDTYIVRTPTGTSAQLSQPCYQTASSQTIYIYRTVLAFTRPIDASNAARQVADAVTNSTTTVTSATANFKGVGIHLGKMVTGTNIPAGTTIATVTNVTTIVLSQAATGSTSGGTLTIHDGRTVADMSTTSASATITSATANFSSLDINAKVVGTGIPNGAYIVSVNSKTSAVISANATSTGSSRFLFIQENKSSRYVEEDMVATALSQTITSATAAFTASDIGKQVTGTNVPNNTYITGVTNATTATLSNVLPYTTTGNKLGIAAPTAMSIVELGLLWVDNVTGNGTQFNYSIDGGLTFTTVTQTSAGTPKLMNNKISTINPTSLIIVSNTTTGTASQTVQAGVFCYQEASASKAGLAFYNIARDGYTMTETVEGGLGDNMAILDNTTGGTFTGIFPDLIILIFTNDLVLYDSQRWWNSLNRFISRVNAYADVIFLSTFDQSFGGAKARTTNNIKTFAKILKKVALEIKQPYWYANDGNTTNGSATITSATMHFSKQDIGKTIIGDGIPANTTITAVASMTSATMSANATATSTTANFYIIADVLDTSNVVLDIFEAWKAQGIRGFKDAQDKEGLMSDVVHQSQLGHNDMARRIMNIIGAYS